jgi:hypothetical protein
MLFNPQWIQKPDLSTASFIGWVNSKDRDIRYNYGSCRHCLIAQYLRQQGCKNVSVSRNTYWYRRGRFSGWSSGCIPFAWNDIAGAFDRYGANSFGAAQDRAVLYTGTETSHAPAR